MADESAATKNMRSFDWMKEQRVTAEVLRRVRLDLHEAQDNLGYAAVDLKEERERADKLEALAHRREEQLNETSERLRKAAELLRLSHLKQVPKHRARLEPRKGGEIEIEVDGQENLPDWCSVCYVIRQSLFGGGR